ncbi:MAG: tRNA lysidine(34) synthetase TilS [Lysobacter sp.]|nr:tRNA lysidine(34) synthetase TilS [Lysobacter sp.]
MPARGALPAGPFAGLFDDARGPLLVGFSGGLDSTVLLHALATNDRVRTHGLRALHVHHGLHADADAWATHCEHACAALDVPLTVARVDVAMEGHGPEAAARVARHAAFAEVLHEDEVLVLAHHRDDQAETFLLRALRGSGVEGLRAMRRWRPFAHGWVWRPLLDVPRATLLDYASQRGLRWIDDPSNADATFDRNFLRHAMLPLLRERWPHADAAFATSAALQAEAAALLEGEDAALFAQARTAAGDTLDLQVLRTWPAARRARVLRRWIDQLGLPPLPARGIACIEAELLPSRHDAEPRFAWSGAVLRKWRDRLHAGRGRVPLPPDWEASWDGHAPLALPTGDVLLLERESADAVRGTLAFDPPLRVAARRGGERIRLPGRTHSHALKHVLQDRDVPPWTRERLPLLWDADGDLLAAGDRIVSAGFADRLRAGDLRLEWRVASSAGHASAGSSALD